MHRDDIADITNEALYLRTQALEARLLDELQQIQRLLVSLTSQVNALTPRSTARTVTPPSTAFTASTPAWSSIVAHTAALVADGPVRALDAYNALADQDIAGLPSYSTYKRWLLAAPNLRLRTIAEPGATGRPPVYVCAA